MARLAKQESRDHPALPEPQAKPVRKVLPDLLALPDLRVLQGRRERMG
ncbi:hypothetical protein GCM10020000_06210 [Streptomyces olivoverticillatus]